MSDTQKPKGRKKLNSGMCANCGINKRVSWSTSYCGRCAGRYASKAARKKLKESLEKGPRVDWCIGCKKQKEIYPPMVYYCKECSQGFSSRNEKTYRKKKWEWLRSLKDGKSCIDCGQSYPYYVMHWDHLRHKEFNLGAAVRLGYDRIRKELEKCELVCANCHAERTHQRTYSIND